jgi:uncharacterized protein YjbI with pentapeptide repeats
VAKAILSQTAGLTFLIAWLAATASAAQDIPPRGQGWSEAEQWAWDEIRAGRIADFNTLDGNLDPRKPDGWDNKRKVSPTFLKEILFREPYRSGIPVEGVRIIGAWFPEPVDLAHGHLNRQLWLDECRFEEAADLTNLHVDGWLSLVGSAFVAKQQGIGLISLNLFAVRVGDVLAIDGATVAGALNMNGLEVENLLIRGPNVSFQDVNLTGAKIGGHLLMHGPDASFRDVDLSGAKIGGQFTLEGTSVAGTLNMNSLEVGQHLSGAGATFQYVDLIGAKVGGTLNMHDAHVAGMLGLGGLEVKGDIFMSGSEATFRDVDLRSAKVGRQLDREDANVTGTLNMNGLQVENLLGSARFRNVDLTGAKVGGLLDMHDAQVAGTLTMASLEVEGDLYVLGPKASFRDVDLSGARVGGNLIMHGPNVSFHDVALRSAKVGGTRCGRRDRHRSAGREWP